MYILVAEDDYTSRTVLSAVLRKSGHEVIETVDGADAWDRLQEADAPRLVILDWMMPVMDGLEVVRRIRARQTERPPYVIMLTAKGEKADIIAGLNAGADDYLAKPFDPGELHARVEVGRRMIEMRDALIESLEALAHQATHDPLTGLLNRRAILDCLDGELARIRRHGGRLFVGMCDIDHFKGVNDTYGHQTGDEVLCQLSRILGENLRKYDSVGRMGGEEFLVITPVNSDIRHAYMFERLCRQVARSEITTRSGALSVTISIGVTVATADRTVDDILEAADKELYRAKNAGRNRVVLNGQCISQESEARAS